MIVANCSGQTIGPYAVDSQIGRGGMGVVYRAHDVGTGRPVALKTVRLRSPEMVSCFRREVHALAALSHPGIVRIVDHGVTDGVPWYAMELISGPTLSRLLQGEQPVSRTAETVADLMPEPPAVQRRRTIHDQICLDISVVCRLASKICHALAFLHAQGLVHRDLKPDNILIRPDNNPVLVDFGLVAQCRDSAGREVLDHANAGMGTVAYMPPEQRFGRVVDARADLFSLGCILFECLTGRLPFGSGGAVHAGFNLPPAPSTLNPSVPAELDAVILGLLARDRHERIGYADDVLAVLARIEPDASLIQGFGNPYLYRPEIVGREASLSRLDRFLWDALGGRGSLMLITGESGVGKTRLLIELGARAAEHGMQVVTGDCPPVGAAEREGGTLGQGLGPFHGLLQTVVDICRSGSSESTQRLLTGRAKVLAPYLPELLSFSNTTPEEQDEILPSEAAKIRVFSSLWGLLCDLAREKPLLLVLDDLHWADYLSLDFLSWMARQPFPPVPLAVVGASRVEEMNSELLALTAQKGVVLEPLFRVDPNSVAEMIAGMLSMPSPPKPLVDFLLAESRGNPFFVAEYIRAAIVGGLLLRGPGGRWTLEKVEAEGELRDRVSAPPTVGELVARRLRHLDSLSLRTVRAAAVLGRAFDIDLVARTAELSIGSVLDAYTTLSRRQILEEDGEGASRFVHDKLREIAYSQTPTDELAALHRRAAESIESRFPGSALDQHFGTIGYHLAKAGDRLRAAHCFSRAGDHARASYANRDARRLYDLALQQLEPSDLGAGGDLWCQVREALGDLDLLDGAPGLARASFSAALGKTPADRTVSRARRRRKRALSWQQEHRHDEALAEHEAALAELGATPSQGDPESEWWIERVQIEVDRAWDFYWNDDGERLTQLVSDIRPMVDRRGLAHQKARYFQAAVHVGFRRGRYVIDEETISDARASLAAAEQAHDVRGLAFARFCLAFTLLLAGLDQEAEPLLVAGLADSVLLGDQQLIARHLAYTSLLHRRRGRLEETRSVATRAAEIAQGAELLDYVGVAHANLCWVAWREGTADLDAHAQTALDAWSKLAPRYIYPLQWLARVPLACHQLALGLLDSARVHLRVLADRKQHRLPDDLAAAIDAALDENASVSCPEIATRFALLCERHRYL